VIRPTLPCIESLLQACTLWSHAHRGARSV